MTKPIRGKGGRPPVKLEPDQVERIKKAAGLGLTFEDISILSGCSIDTLKKYCGDILLEGRANTNAAVASSLFAAAKSGNVTAMIFWLKCRAGWVDRQAIEVTGANGADITPQLTITIEK